jgi:hypothetical protein
MKKTGMFVATMILVPGFGSTVVLAQEEEKGPTVVPLETYTCNYNEGMGSADLDAAVDGWNAWMDEQDAHNYFAMTMTPFYHGAETFDVGWLGVSPTAEEMGAGADAFAAKGGEQAAAFARALTCDTHSNFATIVVKKPPERESPDSLVVAFSDCTVADDTTMDDVFTGLDNWTAYQTESGYMNGTWVFFPAYGGGDEDFDFKMVSAWGSHAARGRDYDLYANAGGYQKRREIMGSMLDCNVSRVYDGEVRRDIKDDE